VVLAHEGYGEQSAHAGRFRFEPLREPSVEAGFDQTRVLERASVVAAEPRQTRPFARQPAAQVRIGEHGERLDAIELPPRLLVPTLFAQERRAQRGERDRVDPFERARGELQRFVGSIEQLQRACDVDQRGHVRRLQFECPASHGDRLGVLVAELEHVRSDREQPRAIATDRVGLAQRFLRGDEIAKRRQHACAQCEEIGSEPGVRSRENVKDSQRLPCFVLTPFVEQAVRLVVARARVPGLASQCAEDQRVRKAITSETARDARREH
jgi:hypothetical protein